MPGVSPVLSENPLLFWSYEIAFAALAFVVVIMNEQVMRDRN
jgi:hypothetical protein